MHCNKGVYLSQITTIKNNFIMTNAQATSKASELNSKFPNLKCKVVKLWNGSLAIKTINSDKAKTLNEMFKGYEFTF